MSAEAPANAFTIDVEDYYQVEAFKPYIAREQWDDFDSRVERNTDMILQLLDDKSVTATFFVLGCVAERHPRIVRKIAAGGHEVASHGYSHDLVYRQTPDEFRQETLRSKGILEEQAQSPIKGYRAATYSITRDSLWALDILVEAGFTYDSSIFPIHHDRYGIPDIDPMPHRLNTPDGRQIVEFPISTLNTGAFNLPISGGGYFRLFPYFFTRWALRQRNRSNKGFIFYIHPWEIDREQPIIEGVGLATRFRHYNGIDRCSAKLARLLDDFRFTTVASVLKNQQFVI